MLYLGSIELENFCQHKRKVIQFSRGINIIIGPNGSGKSNLLNAILFAFLGIVDRRNKQSLIRIGCQPEEAYVRLNFEFDSRAYSIYRDLKDTAYLIDASSGLRVEGIAKVNQWIQEHLGIDRRLYDHIIISQGEIDRFLLLSKEKRVEFLMNLIPELPLFEKIWRSFSYVIDNIPRFVVPQKIGREKIKRLQSKLKRYSRYLTIAEKKLKEIDQTLSLSISEEDFNRIQNRITELDLQVKNSDETISSLERELQTIDTKLQELSIDEKELPDLKKQYVTICAQLENIADLKNKIYDLSRELKNLFENRPKTNRSLYRRIEWIEKLLNTNKEDRESLKRALLSSRCHFCRTVLTERHKQFIKKLLLELEAQNEKLSKTLDRLKAQSRIPEEENIQRRKRIRELVKILKEYKEKLKNEENLLATKKLLEHKISILEQLITSKQKASNELIFHRNVCKRNRELLDELTKQISGRKPISKQNFDTLKEQAAKYQLFIDKFRDRETIYRTKIKTLIEMVKHRRIVMIENKKNDLLRLKLNSIRSQFHRSVLPSAIIKKLCDSIIAKMNEILGALNVNFRIEGISEDCEFITSVEGHQVSDRLLSGGQRISLAIAFCLAKLFLIFDQSNVLIFDEPTVYLDEDSRDGLCSLLSVLSNAYTDRRIQIIIATHDSKLRQVASSIVEIQ